MFRKITSAFAISRLDLEFARAGSTIVGNFRVGITRAREEENARRARILIALMGALIALPAVIGTIGGILKQFFGLPFLFDAVVSWNEPIAKASLFIGAPLALVANLLAVTRIGFQRAEGKISTFLALEASPLVLFVLGMAFIVVALFWGHLFADGLACIRVVRAAC